MAQPTFARLAHDLRQRTAAYRPLRMLTAGLVTLATAFSVHASGDPGNDPLGPPSERPTGTPVPAQVSPAEGVPQESPAPSPRRGNRPYPTVPLPEGPGPVFTNPTTAAAMLNRLLPSVPPGVTINSATFTGSTQAAGLFSNINFNNNNVSVVLPDGIVLTTGRMPSASNTAANFSTNNGAAGDAAMNTLLGQATFNAASLLIDFNVDVTVTGVEFQFVFGSDEFPEYVGSSFNDGFAAFLDGTNVAFDTQNRPITINGGFLELANAPATRAGTTPVTFPIEYDGLTRRLVSSALLTPGRHTLRFVIADGGDSSFDSGVFIAGLSFGTVCPGTGVPPTFPTIPATLPVDVLASGSLSFSATDGTPSTAVTFSTSPIILPDGVTFTQTTGNPASGTLTFAPGVAQYGQSYPITIIARNSNGVCSRQTVTLTATASIDLSVAAESIVATPTAPVAAYPTQLSATVGNVGPVAGTCTVSFYVGGLPAAGGTLIGTSASVTVPANGNAVATVPWPTAGLSGARQVCAVVNNQSPARGNNAANDSACANISVLRAPDLQASAIGVPARAIIGRPVSVSWTSSNTGETATTTSWTERVYISADQTLDASDVLAATVTVPGPLNPGQGAQRSVQVAVPGTAGTYWVIVQTDALNTIIEDTGEANNVTVAASPFQAVLPPDLTVTGVSAPSELTRGVSFQLSWTDTNQGQFSTVAGFNDQIIASSNPTIGDADDVVIAALSVGPVEAGGSVPRSATVTLPPSFPFGPVYFAVIADSNNNIAEGDESNNRSVSAASTLSAPDLAVADLSVPSPIGAGQTVTVTYNVTNSGPRTAPARTDRIILSGNSTLGDGDDVVIGTFAGPALGAGASQPVSTPVVIPAGTALGGVSIFVVVDATSGIPELNENNNTAGPAATTVSGPDLSITQAFAPSELTAGQSFLITWTLQNSGPFATSSNFVDRIIASPNAVIGDGDDVVLADVSFTGTLAAGATAPRSATVTLPPGIPLGTVRLAIRTDANNAIAEPNETNNQSVTLVADLSAPDLAGSGLTVPPLVAPGQTFTVSYTVDNTGPRNAATRTDRIVLSRNAALGDADDVVIGSYSGAALASGASQPVSTPVTIPSGTPLGGVSIFVVIDAADAVVETSEANNTVGPAPTTLSGPDLSISEALAPTELTAGRPFLITWTVQNSGPFATTTTFVDRIIASPNAIIGDADDVILADVPFTGSLAANASAPRSATVTLPPGIPLGTVRLVIKTDVANAIAEPNEANNQSATLVSELSAPDLTVTGLSVSPDATLGRPVTVSWTTNNAGPRAVAGSWVESIVVSANGILGDADDQVAYSARFSDPLTPGASATRSVQYTVPVVPPGNYTVFVVLDSAGEIRETDETNNASAPFSVGVSASDLVASGLTGPSFAALGQTITLSYPVSNTGGRPALPRADRVILSRNATLGDGDDRSLATPSQPALAAGADRVESVTLTIPADAPSGDSFLFVRIDDNNANTELSETNNATVALPISIGGPDLSISSITVPATATFGQAIPVTWTLTNAGNSPTAATFRTAITLVRSGGASTTLLVQETASPVAAGQSLPQSASVTLPVDFTGSGPATIQIVADSTAVIAETREDNNAALSSSIQLSPTPSADLRALAVGGPSSSNDGESIPVTWTVANIGGANAGPGWLDSIYLSSDQTLDSSDRLLGTFARNGALTAGTQYTRNDAVVIPAGLSGNFYLIVVTDSDNRISEPGTGAEANNSTASATPIVVTQSQLPDLVISTLSAPTNRYASQQVSIPITVQNAGPGTVYSRIIDRVFFGPDTGGDPTSTVGLTQLGEFSRAEQIRPGFGYALPVNLTLPATPGQYKVVSITDVAGDVNEANENNNRRSVSFAVIAPEYNATLTSALTAGFAGQIVTLSGRATVINTGQPAAGVDVRISVFLRDSRRDLTARTDIAGNFTVNFTPLPTESGLYSAFARHPQALDPAAAQVTFTTYGIRTDQGAVSSRVVPGTPRSGTVRVYNLGNSFIDGLTASPNASLPNVNLALSLASTIPGDGFVDLNYVLTSDSPSPLTGTIPVTIASSRTTPVVVSFFIDAGPLAPSLVAEPTEFDSAMVRGSQTTISTVIRNVGGLPTGPLTVQVPAAPWLFLATPANLPSLLPGQTATITLNLIPSATLTLGRYSGSIAVSGSGAGLSLPFNFDCISLGRGSLRVVCSDEFTYFAADHPKLQGASVVVRDLTTNAVVTQATSDADGVALFPDLAEANYKIEVSAPQHGNFSTQTTVNAAREKVIEAFLARQTVSYSWSVIPVTTEDRYQISIEAVFQTNVPAPVVTIDPPFVDLTQYPDSVFQINFTITNHGLIAANDVRLDYGTSGPITMTPLVSTIGTLAPNSSVTVPVTFTRGEGLACYQVRLETIYFYYCGELRSATVPALFRTPNCGRPWIIEFPRCDDCVCLDCTVPPPPPPFDLTVPQVIQDIFCCITRKDCILSIAGMVPGRVGYAATGYGIVTSGSVLEGVGRGWDAVAGIVWPPYGLGSGACGVIRDCIVSCFYPPAGRVPCGLGDFVKLMLTPGEDDGPPPDDLALASFRREYLNLQRVLRPYTLVLGDDQLFTSNGDAFVQFAHAFGAATRSDSPGGTTITEDETLLMLSVADPAVPAARIRLCAERWNRTLAYEALGIRSIAQVPVGMSTDIIDQVLLESSVAAANAVIAEWTAQGYVNISDAIIDAARVLDTARRSEGQGVCAQVRIRIDQELAVTREAFRATLGINNNSTADPISAITASITVQDENGVDATALFNLGTPSPSGFNGPLGALTLSPSGAGELTWLIVPSRDAAPTAPKSYAVSGSFSYTSQGQVITVPLYPVRITVLPNPQLKLKYFLERDVFSDDPFTTDITEPAVPFNLGLMVQNTGAGAANNLRLTSSQPRIVENVRGLLIDFNIIGSTLNGNPRTTSLEVDFGNLGPGQISTALFGMTTSLQGRFSTFTGTFRNLNGLGQPGFSIIDSLDTYLTTHVVLADGPGSDNLPDFLTDQTADPLFLPDHVHLSSGQVEDVTAIRQFGSSIDPSASTARIALNSIPSGYFYIRMNDPFDARLRLAEVIRSDGKRIQVGPNAWQTSKINRDGSGGVAAGTPERYVHLFDRGGTGVYTLVFTTGNPGAALSPLRLPRVHGAAGTLEIPIRADGATSECRVGGVPQLIARFAQPILASSFGQGSVVINGRDASNAPINMAGRTLTLSVADGGLTGVVDISPPLPDRARYCVDLIGIRYAASGNPMASENGRSSFLVLAGDGSSDGRLNNTDVGGILSASGTVLALGAAQQALRADINADGVVNQADLDLVLAARGLDLRSIPDACPPRLVTGPTTGPGTGPGSSPNPGSTRNGKPIHTTTLADALTPTTPGASDGPGPIVLTVEQPDSPGLRTRPTQPHGAGAILACNAADIVGPSGAGSPPDGVLDANDFIAFINAYALGAPLADIAGPGGVAGADGRVDADDFLLFTRLFSSGCP